MALFNIGKKNLDDKMLAGISLELAMLFRWHEVNIGRTLTFEEAEEIANRILIREGFKRKKEEITTIVLAAFASDINQVDGLRERTDFDKTIVGFFNSIGMSAPKSYKGSAKNNSDRLNNYSDFADQLLFDLHTLNLVIKMIETGQDLDEIDTFDSVVAAISNKYPYDEDFGEQLYETTNTIYCLLEINEKNSFTFVRKIIDVLLKNIYAPPTIEDFVNEHRKKYRHLVEAANS
jgi:hypothetical protein